MAGDNIFLSTILTCVVHFENEKLMLAVLIYTNCQRQKKCTLNHTQ